MPGNHSPLRPIADTESPRTSMMALWKERLQQTAQQQQKPEVLAQSEQETRADLEQRIRNGQAACPTCAERSYQDESDDGGVSFQAAKHIPTSMAGVVVTSHEQEHVAAGKADQAEDGLTRSSTVMLEHAKCEECGRTYVKGGVTRTRTQATASPRRTDGNLDIEV